jgi:DNA recombination protein RmuC
MAIDTNLLATAILLVGVLVACLVLLRRLRRLELLQPLVAQLQALANAQERVDRGVRDEIARNRDEGAAHAKSLREEIGGSVKAAGDSLVKSVAEISNVQKVQLEGFSGQLSNLAETSETAARGLREEIAAALKTLTESVVGSMNTTADLQGDHLKVFGDNLQALAKVTEEKLDGMREAVECRLGALQETNNSRLDQMRDSANASGQKAREELTASLRGFNDSIVKSMGEIAALQKSQVEGFAKQVVALTESNERKHDALRAVVEERLTLLQADNATKLDQMRQTVDEKLQKTLEKRLSDSFSLVSERLEKVHQGLGEMQTLAIGVGDLKKVLSNVKARGTWGEVQLENLLEQILTPEQFSKNVATKDGSGERVEFAIKLPGRDEDAQDVVWLPLDAKCPQGDYDRLLDAREKGHAEAAEVAGRNLEAAIKVAARTISEKYVNPPKTTDFAIMFLPTEGLFAEIVRRPGLVETLQRDYRVVLAGPTTLVALLNSLQMGFRTLAIQKRSSEVWAILGTVKAEFGKFGDILTGVRKRLQQASDTIDNAVTKTRTIERKLRGVQELPRPNAERLLGRSADPVPEDGSDDEKSQEPSAGLLS